MQTHCCASRSRALGLHAPVVLDPLAQGAGQHLFMALNLPTAIAILGLVACCFLAVHPPHCHAAAASGTACVAHWLAPPWRSVVRFAAPRLLGLPGPTTHAPASRCTPSRASMLKLPAGTLICRSPSRRRRVGWAMVRSSTLEDVAVRPFQADQTPCSHHGPHQDS